MGSHAQTRHAKVRDALHRVGASVFNGAFSTFLAVVAMANSQTYVFRVFFKQFFLVTSMGLFHGLIVLPVLLSWFGPDRMVKNEQKVEDTGSIQEGGVELNGSTDNERTQNVTEEVEV